MNMMAILTMRGVVSHIASWGRCVVLWFIIMLPLSPTVWRLYAMGPTCFTPAWAGVGVQPAACLIGFAAAAPFAVIFGPLGHDEEEAPSELPEVLLTALLLAILITTLSLIIRKLKAKNSN